MPAPKGNQFAKGNKGGGRKGYEFEEAQLKRMGEILNQALKLTEKVIGGTATKQQRMAYEGSIKMALKIMDKLHANRQETKMDIASSKEPITIKWISN